VTLVVTGNTISGWIFLLQRVPEFYRHRLLLTGSRCYIHWVIDRRTKPTFCVFPVMGVAVMGGCCDASRDWQYYFRSAFLASQDARVKDASTAVHMKSI
jgi:hypothetical protein